MPGTTITNVTIAISTTIMPVPMITAAAATPCAVAGGGAAAGDDDHHDAHRDNNNAAADDDGPRTVDSAITPEENLDSESIYSLLSHYFRSAKSLRQVIVITHNPNRVVNTDSDQVIVASADRITGAFPTFSYVSGGLEDPVIREKVCRILEGGATAFLKREERYALRSG